MVSGARAGSKYPEIGCVMRGGREMSSHFEVMWDLFRSVFSIETEGSAFWMSTTG